MGVGLASLLLSRTEKLQSCRCSGCFALGSAGSSLMRQLLGELHPEDTLVADSYHCNYWLIAACILRKVKIVMKNHHKRDDHPANARRIGKGKRLVVWERPTRPEWMTQEEYDKQPKTIEIRLVDVQVQRAGFRTDSFTVATTMLDRKVHSASWIRSVYQSRWLVETNQPHYDSSEIVYRLAV